MTQGKRTLYQRLKRDEPDTFQLIAVGRRMFLPEFCILRIGLIERSAIEIDLLIVVAVSESASGNNYPLRTTWDFEQSIKQLRTFGTAARQLLVSLLVRFPQLMKLIRDVERRKDGDLA